jgi:myosin heavy subunit
LLGLSPVSFLTRSQPDTIAAYQKQAAERTSDLAPHVYKIAADALTGVLDFSQNQSIIIRYGIRSNIPCR